MSQRGMGGIMMTGRPEDQCAAFTTVTRGNLSAAPLRIKRPCRLKAGHAGPHEDRFANQWANRSEVAHR